MSLTSRERIPSAVVLGVGLVVGWLANSRPVEIKASGGGDRFGDFAVASGPVAIQYSKENKTQASLDAIYFLDYRGARLLATIPSLRQTLTPGATVAKLIDEFAERDLMADFHLDENGPAPHFVMTTGSLGALGDGSAPLFVFETTTKQVAAYRSEALATGRSSKPKFELMQLRSFAKPPPSVGSNP
jgi:hypothetical protein